MYCHWLKKNEGGTLCAHSALELRGLVSKNESVNSLVQASVKID